MTQPFGCLTLVTLTLALCGCNQRELDKVIVSGTVTYAGKPIPNGEIRFHPTNGTKGPVSGATIIDGEYLAEGKGGVPVGTHRVTIKAYRPETSGQTVEPGEQPFFEQYLPPKYHRDSTMELAVPGDRSTLVKDFTLD